MLFGELIPSFQSVDGNAFCFWMGWFCHNLLFCNGKENTVIGSEIWLISKPYFWDLLLKFIPGRIIFPRLYTFFLMKFAGSRCIKLFDFLVFLSSLFFPAILAQSFCWSFSRWFSYSCKLQSISTSYCTIFEAFRSLSNTWPTIRSRTRTLV